MVTSYYKIYKYIIMKNLILWSGIFSVLLFLSCNRSNNSEPNIIGFYECEMDGSKVDLSFYTDSTFMQYTVNKSIGEIQFNGTYKWSTDTLFLLDEYTILDGVTISSKDLTQDLPENEKNRMLKLVSFDGNILILRDLRTQKIWEYRLKEK